MVCVEIDLQKWGWSRILPKSVVHLEVTRIPLSRELKKGAQRESPEGNDESWQA